MFATKQKAIDFKDSAPCARRAAKSSRKSGNPEIRTLLVVGATAVLRVVRNDAQAQPRLKALLAIRPFKVAAVAQANKTARTIWALLNKGGTYRRPAPLAIAAVAV
ncbi:hypothetical protein [Bradyrhizobium sp. CCGUVB1N3]|uniref:hypothetical protein n=1 Tax=Bradyrhizobium sp. CCGUVB1N3 TaxID=2949629 RepID=UPI00353229FC